MKKNENAPAEVQHRDSEEDRTWRGFSLFLHVLLPIAGLALLWGQRGFFSKLLLQLDRSCVAVYCPSFSKREKLLKWAGERLPLTWSSQARTLSSGIPELWKDGSLLCTLINSVVPGACPNPHRHWRKPPLHAQALAYKYLGLVPMFTDAELSGDFTINQEQNFIRYLHKLQEAINKWSAKDESNRKFSSQYVARGMGLYTGEQHRKTVFYLYSNATAKKRNNVLMYIRGPYGTRGKATISPFHNLKTIPVVNVLQDQLAATKILPFKNEEQKSFLKTISLDFTSLVSGVEDNSDECEIPIQIDMEIDRAKITYIPKVTGIYEINLICEGELLKGSPYSVRISKNASSKKDNFSNDCEKVEEKITFTKRKVLSKIIDCIDEKIRIDNHKILMKDSQSSTDSDSDDLTITAITKKKDEILKTEISCTLEDIIEEINVVQEKNSVNGNVMNEIKMMAEHLKEEIPSSMVNSTNTDLDEVDNPVSLQIDSQHKFVKDSDEATTELVNLLQTEVDEFDSGFGYNVETEKEVLTPEKSLMSQFDIGLIKSTKCIKDIVNTSKQEMLEKFLPTKDTKEDENNNPSLPHKRIKSKIYLEISPKKIKSTSPICPDHIAPEVENSLKQLTLSQRRRTLSKQDSFNISDSDVAFSPENDGTSQSSSGFRELSVLNVLDSLRPVRKNSLSSTVSLPNMGSVDSGASIDESTFKSRKEYWERMSSRSSSSVSLANSDYAPKTPRITPKKNFIKKSSESQKNVSIDTSLEDCTLISLEERKKQLLKNMYVQETQAPKRKIKFNFLKKDKTKTEEENVLGPIEICDKKQSLEKEETKKISAKHMLKSQFKKAINFFKNLEQNSSTVQTNKSDIKRRHSLDYQKKTKRKTRGGSLNLQNISDRFSVNNLYEDVLGGRRGSFKGAPNKAGVASSLASLSSGFEEEPHSQDENTISYNLFANKAKSKKRKSVRSLFDVNY